jgi:hypothetical protein
LVPQIDTPAERALRMIEWGVADLPADLRAAWARLIATFAIRTPETLGALGAGEFRKVMEIAHGNGDLPPPLDAVAGALNARHSSAPDRNAPPNPALALASDRASTGIVAAMDCGTAVAQDVRADRPRRFRNRRVPSPYIALDDPDCLIMLPVAPDTVFFATANPPSSGDTQDLKASWRAWSTRRRSGAPRIRLRPGQLKAVSCRPLSQYRAAGCRNEACRVRSQTSFSRKERSHRTPIQVSPRGTASRDVCRRRAGAGFIEEMLLSRAAR